MKYIVTLSDGTDIYDVEANSAEGAIREVTERGEQVASAELNLDGVDITALYTLTDGEEIVTVAKAIARTWLTTSDGTHIALGMIAAALARRNTVNPL